MKKYIFIIITLLVLSVLCIVFNHHTVIIDKEKKVSTIKSHINTIRSISPKDTTFTDLIFLKDLLKDKSIVMLGEATHIDGATFLGKSRLIKFLHKELGFDVIIYETGLYDTYNLWKKIKETSKPNPKNFSEALYNFWYDNKENEYLINYILQNVNTNKEIEIAGFDVQFTGQIKNNERDLLLNEYLKTQNGIDLKVFPSFYTIKKFYSSYVNSWVFKSLSRSKQDSVLSDIQSIVSVLEEIKLPNQTDSLYIRFFKNLNVLYTYTWKHQYLSERRFQIRDSAMAENFIWLKENKFKNRKVIIWAANLHISYDNYSYYPTPARFNSMGEYIKKKYGSQCYSINFTSFSNNTKSGSSEEAYNNKTIEYLLHQIHEPYLYLDFNSIDSSSFLHDPIIMNCNQNLSFNAYWSKITDGILYIDNMTELHKLKE